MARLLGQLSFRLSLASAVLAIIIGVTFGLLIAAIEDLRDAGSLAEHSRAELTAADGLGALVIDLETGARGFVITKQERFLQPWYSARRAFPGQATRFVRLIDEPEQAVRARRIVGEARSYIQDYSVPLVRAVRRGSTYPGGVAATAEGKRRVDAIRAGLDRFATVERRLLTERQDGADADGSRAIVIGIVGLAGSLALIGFFAIYLLRGVGRPIRRAAGMAGRVAGGDLTARMDESGVGEIGALERSFNTMTGSLEQSRDRLAMLLREQEGLRRVATLVAEGADPARIFEAVSREIGLLCDADFVRLSRYDGDGMVTHLARWARVEDEPTPVALGALGSSVPLPPGTLAAVVLETGAPETRNTLEDLGPAAAEARALGVKSAVGCPITVEGRLWGAVSAGSTRELAFTPQAEVQIGEFTELVGTAIANAVNRDELVASRARIVAAADEARRRIRRDLHDGAQQRLVHSVITLKLARRALAEGGPKARALLDEGLENAEGATAALRDLSHGILPSVLTRGGLRAGVESLVARIALPVGVEVEAKRFAPGVEATAYFVVSEALTNVLKHSGATRADVFAGASDGVLRVEIRDDGRGGAAPGGGSGLVGLRDRVAAQGGSLRVESPPGAGTTIVMTLPLSE